MQAFAIAQLDDDRRLPLAERPQINRFLPGFGLRVMSPLLAPAACWRVHTPSIAPGLFRYFSDAELEPGISPAGTSSGNGSPSTHTAPSSKCSRFQMGTVRFKVSMRKRLAS